MSTSAVVEAAPTCRAWRWVRRIAVAFGLAVLVILVAHRPLLTGFASLFRVDNPVPSDAIVILLGGANHRVAKAAELYQRGYAPVILIGESGLEPVLDYDESKLIRQYLMKRGVPGDAIEILPGGTVEGTRDESLRVRAYAEKHAVRSIIIVTTAFHTARAQWIFRRVLAGADVRITMAAAAHPHFRESNWWRSELGVIAYFEELVKTIFYRLKY